MSANVAESWELLANPVEVAEQVVAAHDLSFERFSTDDLAAEYAGSWCAYQLWFAYRQDIQALHFSCGFDVRVPLERREAIYPLLARINEQLWLGHFDLWTEEGQPTYRHSVLFRGGPPPSYGLIEDMIGIAVAECERYYPAFQHVIWGGKSAADAVAAAIIETAGEA